MSSLLTFLEEMITDQAYAVFRYLILNKAAVYTLLLKDDELRSNLSIFYAMFNYVEYLYM
jgi:hypothetical protein